jgi:RNA polymerase sigma factor (sigma-70 family)
MGGNKRVGATDRKTFAREAMAHLDHLYRVAFHLVKDQDHAQDLVQETFVRALAAHDQFNPGTNMKASLTKILHNFFFDYYHQSKLWISTEGPTEQEPDYWAGRPAENPGSHILLSAECGQIFGHDKKMNFYAFCREAVNAVLHREGDVICILVSEMSMDDLLALARSKARPS